MEKQTAHTTPLIREFIEQARFFVLATSDAAGNCDCSPRGDLVSQVLFPDEKTLVLPDRPGNRRADSYRNMIENPHVGILFSRPGTTRSCASTARRLCPPILICWIRWR
ncbi:pyridoxamine 5'-phosphate oxidase family protein [Rhodococcus sp. 3.70]